ncbi:hypothetical protein AB6D12_07980 [Vibrio cyclitrophicus]
MSFENSRLNGFLASIPKASIESDKDTLAAKCKFNFGYFDSNTQDFRSWEHGPLVKLMDKLKDFSRESLKHWEDTPCKSGDVLKIYGKFPSHSKFTKPKHVPHQARWGTFRIEAKVRLAGFVIPEAFNHTEQNLSGYRFCSNTFYVVFLDKEHEFYPVEKKDRKRKVRR